MDSSNNKKITSSNKCENCQCITKRKQKCCNILQCKKCWNLYICQSGYDKDDNFVKCNLCNKCVTWTSKPVSY